MLFCNNSGHSPKGMAQHLVFFRTFGFVGIFCFSYVIIIDLFCLFVFSTLSPRFLFFFVHFSAPARLAIFFVQFWYRTFSNFLSKFRHAGGWRYIRSTYQIFEWDQNNSDLNFFNVVRYVHLPLVPWMQERSEAERRAIWDASMLLLGEGSEVTEPYNKHNQIRPHSIRSLQFDQKVRLLSFRSEKFDVFTATPSCSVRFDEACWCWSTSARKTDRRRGRCCATSATARRRPIWNTCWWSSPLCDWSLARGWWTTLREVLSRGYEEIEFFCDRKARSRMDRKVRGRIVPFPFQLGLCSCPQPHSARGRDVSSPAIWATKISAHFGDNNVAQMFRQICSHTPSALNAGAKRSRATCHMAMPQCCYLAKGAKRPSHTTNMITSLIISGNRSIWSTHLDDTFVPRVTDAILSPKWLVTKCPWHLSKMGTKAA